MPSIRKRLYVLHILVDKKKKEKRVSALFFFFIINYSIYIPKIGEEGVIK